MKIGVKTFSNEQVLEHFKDKVDFFEIMAVEKNDYDFLKKFKLPIVIHAQHSRFNIDYADKLKKEINLKSINFAIDLANKTKSNKIIVHPGSSQNKTCSKEQAIDFLKNIDDKRILIENLIPLEDSIGLTPLDIKEFLDKTNKKFCLDINHAIETATSLKQDYIQVIKEFLKLKPIHYHLGGQIIKESKTHLSLEDSDFDIKEIISLLPKNAEITLETTMDIDKLDKDVEIIKKIINELDNYNANK
ncbi:hypothetical protein J4218_02030 [Candidatus Pacearchaeota archaeon]|nr:hypothetical protein [uncultured archaeon]AQS29130.1 hypothetical protein [uncultured archaeon]AQS29714.1 hypothetical protein [uncultured archaeon]MBS3078876.1 hypothetical protein [Candidatus Pacearchaeota archaeon]